MEISNCDVTGDSKIRKRTKEDAASQVEEQIDSIDLRVDPHQELKVQEEADSKIMHPTHFDTNSIERVCMVGKGV